jgi:hypothetical protein
VIIETLMVREKINLMQKLRNRSRILRYGEGKMEE